MLVVKRFIKSGGLDVVVDEEGWTEHRKCSEAGFAERGLTDPLAGQKGVGRAHFLEQGCFVVSCTALVQGYHAFVILGVEGRGGEELVGVVMGWCRQGQID